MRFVDEHRDRYAVALLLRVLQITPSTYYGWVDQAKVPCDRDLVDLGLLSNIYEIWEASGRTYGADRVHQQLRRDGIAVGRKRIERLMAAHGWQGAFLRRRWRISSTRQDPKATPAPDLVQRQFTAPAPNRLWVADATRIPCGEGVFWLAAVRDAFSNRIVGWKTSDRCDTDLILAALEYGIWSRDVRDQQLIHHSDRGSNYNALMENFWSTLKIELAYRNTWRTRDEAENAIFTYIDGWYNTRRILKELGYLSPDEYETAWHTTQAEQPETAIVTPTPAGAR